MTLSGAIEIPLVYPTSFSVNSIKEYTREICGAKKKLLFGSCVLGTHLHVKRRH
jgi:hypothetical protein